MAVVVRLETGTIEPARELKALIRDSSGDGAIVSFVGLARPTDKDGNVVDELVLEHHPRLTIESLEEIGGRALGRFAVSDVRIVHRCGAVSPGDPIVFAGAAAAHRRVAFDAADFLMDCLKTDALFWKREEGAAGTRWIEAAQSDLTDRERWG